MIAVKYVLLVKIENDSLSTFICRKWLGCSPSERIVNNKVKTLSKYSKRIHPEKEQTGNSN
ncbi:hypothetical protein DJ568_16305 [Mucilaginibacter hurinus]|uniref:Uncharacterized protein n=1 Tax=Mucilaginibacter hurinus TaxID=2201324 RepID=A0A367GLE7_9SPHI|nr:hypothetical protein DJ568_16305 [Mucilaginibacter hurinus]